LHNDQSHDIRATGAERDPNAELGCSLVDEVGRDSENSDGRQQQGQRAETTE